MNTKTGLMLAAIVLVAVVGTMAVVSNPAFAPVRLFKNRGDCVSFNVDNGVPGKTAAKNCKGI